MSEYVIFTCVVHINTANGGYRVGLMVDCQTRIYLRLRSRVYTASNLEEVAN